MKNSIFLSVAMLLSVVVSVSAMESEGSDFVNGSGGNTVQAGASAGSNASTGAADSTQAQVATSAVAASALVVEGSQPTTPPSDSGAGLEAPEVPHIPIDTGSSSASEEPTDAMESEGSGFVNGSGGNTVQAGASAGSNAPTGTAASTQAQPTTPPSDSGAGENSGSSLGSEEKPDGEAIEQLTYWESFKETSLCKFVIENPRPFKIIALSGGSAAVTALVIKLFGNKKISKKKAALRAGLATAALSTVYYYGPDVCGYLKSCVSGS